MSILAFVLIAIVLAVYALLDGYDLGVGAIDLFVARSERERAEAMAAIGPVWNGNEVWLIAGGGALFALFPQAYASAFSAFYLPFVMVLWLLMFRGIAMELRNHFTSDLWRSFFDVAFSLSSALLIMLLGVAIGNVLRGVPLDSGFYFLGTLAFLLNPYSLGVALLGIAALSQHGAAFLAWQTQGSLANRSEKLVSALWPVVVVLYIGLTVGTFFVHSPIANLQAMPVLSLIPLASIAGLIGVRVAQGVGHSRAAFRWSGVFVIGLIGSAAATVYPDLLSPYPPGSGGLTIYENAPSPTALGLTIAIISVGLVAVAFYRAIIARRLFDR